MHVILPAAL